MRLKVTGTHPAAKVLIARCRHPKVNIPTSARLPHKNVTLDGIPGKLVEVVCPDAELEYVLLRQLRQVGINRLIVEKPPIDDKSILTCRIPFDDEAVGDGVEVAVFRALLLHKQQYGRLRMFLRRFF